MLYTKSFDDENSVCEYAIEALKIINEISPNAYSFLCSQLSPDTPEGRYDLADGCYVSVETYTTFNRSERKYENHHDYVDVQIVLSGEEIIEIAPVQALRCTDEYNAEKDIISGHMDLISPSLASPFPYRFELKRKELMLSYRPRGEIYVMPPTPMVYYFKRK